MVLKLKSVSFERTYFWEKRRSIMLTQRHSISFFSPLRPPCSCRSADLPPNRPVHCQLLPIHPWSRPLLDLFDPVFPAQSWSSECSFTLWYVLLYRFFRWSCLSPTMTRPLQHSFGDIIFNASLSIQFPNFLVFTCSRFTRGFVLTALSFQTLTSAFPSVFLRVRVSEPYVTTALISVWYIWYSMLKIRYFWSDLFLRKTLSTKY